MTRRITANFYMTLDGYGEFPPYPGSDAVPEEPSDAWKEMWSNRYDSVDTIIFGRRSYEGHQTEFSLAVGKFSDGPYYMLDYCRFLERVRKIVISSSTRRLTGRTPR